MVPAIAHSDVTTLTQEFDRIIEGEIPGGDYSKGIYIYLLAACSSSRWMTFDLCFTVIGIAPLSLLRL